MVVYKSWAHISWVLKRSNKAAKCRHFKWMYYSLFFVNLHPLFLYLIFHSLSLSHIFISLSVIFLIFSFSLIYSRHLEEHFSEKHYSVVHKCYVNPSSSYNRQFAIKQLQLGHLYSLGVVLSLKQTALLTIADNTHCRHRISCKWNALHGAFSEVRQWFRH